MSKALREQKCLKPLDRLGGADEMPGAAAHHVGDAGLLIDLAHRRRAANRADLRENIGRSACGPLVEHDFENLRDHVAGALHDDGVADAHVLPRDFVLVVERGVPDDDAADRDRLQLGDRRQRAGASDLNLDPLEHGRRALRRELVRDRPARTARDETQPLLKRKIVDLVDHAVDVVAEGRALGFDRAVVRQHLLGRLAEPGQRVGRQTEAAHRLDRAELRRREGFADLAPGVGEEGKRPRRGDARIELAQRAGGEIARVGVDRLPRLGLARVERFEIGVAHIDFAARLEDARRAVEPMRDRFDRAHVGGDVLALEAVAARRRPDELAVLVAQVAGEAVDLRLGGHGERRIDREAKKAPHPRAKFLDLLVSENVAERKHRHGVPDLGEFLRRRRADLAIGGFRVGEFGKGGLKRGVAAAQLVISRIGNRRRVFAMIAAVMLGDLRAEPLMFGPRLGERRLGRGRLLGHGVKASAGQGSAEGEHRPSSP